MGRTAYQPLNQQFVAVPQVSVSINVEIVLVKVSGLMSASMWTLWE